MLYAPRAQETEYFNQHHILLVDNLRKEKKWFVHKNVETYSILVTDRIKKISVTLILPSIGGMTKFCRLYNPCICSREVSGCVVMAGQVTFCWTGCLLRKCTQHNWQTWCSLYRANRINGTLTLFGRHSTSLSDKHIGATWHRNLSVNWIMIGTCLFSAKPLQGLVYGSRYIRQYEFC